MQGVLAAMGRIHAALGMSQGQHGVVCNGRVVTVPHGHIVSSEEFQLMQYVAMSLQPGSKVLEIILQAQEHGRTSFISTEGLLSKVSSSFISHLHTRMTHAWTAAAQSPSPDSFLSCVHHSMTSSMTLK